MPGASVNFNHSTMHEPPPCYFFRFGLIVTGDTENDHLPKLFSLLIHTGICHFEVIRQIGQRSPITADKRKAKMVGQGQAILTKDEEEIGIPARRYLDDDPCRFVLLIDDLEHQRRNEAQQVFDRYRLALDTILNPEQQTRASVHFLVNMLEAYYFADAKAVNLALDLDPPLTDHSDDVESIRHPKGMLQDLYPRFHERDDGGRILDNIRSHHILSRPDTCAWLRTLFAWCVKVLQRYPAYDSLGTHFHNSYRFADGIFSEVTKGQIEIL